MSNMSTGSVEVHRERERQARIRHQLLERESSPQPIFSEPIKVNYSPQDETSRRIRDTLGDFTQIQPFLANDPKHLIGIARAAPGAPVPSRPNTGSGEIGRHSSNARTSLVISNNQLSSCDLHKKPTVFNGHKSSVQDKGHSSLLSSKSSDSKSRQRFEHHKSSSHRNLQQDVHNDKTCPVSSQQSGSSGCVISNVVNKTSPSNPVNGQLRNGTVHSHSSSKRTSAKQNLTKLKISELADPNADSHIELENILKEMKQAVPPPLTAIETPRTEETRFHFSPQDHSVSQDVPAVIKSSHTPPVDPSAKEVTPSINLDKDLEMSDSDDDLDEVSPAEKEPEHSVSSIQSPSLRIPEPPPLLQAMSSSSATSSGSDSEYSSSESNESDSSASSEHSVSEPVVKPTTQSWKLSDFMDKKKNSPAFIPLDTGGSNSASKDDHFSQDHLSATTEKDTLVDEDSVNGLLGRCYSQDIKDYFKESSIPELELDPSSPSDHRCVPKFLSSPANCVPPSSPPRGPRTPPLPPQEDEEEEGEVVEEKAINSSHHSKRTGSSSEAKSHGVKNGVKIKIRLGKVSSSDSKCKGSSELEKSSAPATKDNSCKESKKANMEVSSSVTKALATTTTSSSSVPSAVSSRVSSKSHKHASSSVSKKEKSHVKNASGKELKKSESSLKINSLPKENSSDASEKTRDHSTSKERSVSKERYDIKEYALEKSRDHSAGKEGNVCKDYSSNSNTPKSVTKENKTSLSKRLPKTKTKVEKCVTSDSLLKKVPKSKEFLSSSDSDSDNYSNEEKLPVRAPVDVKRDSSIKKVTDVKKEVVQKEDIVKKEIVKKEDVKKDDVKIETDVKRENVVKKELDVAKEPKMKKESLKRKLKSTPLTSKCNRSGVKQKDSSFCSSTITEVINSVARGEIFCHQQNSPLQPPNNRTSLSEIANLSSSKVCERLEPANKDSPVHIVPPQLLSPIPPDSLNSYEFKENAIPSVVVSIDLTLLQRVPPYPPVSHTTEKYEIRERTDCLDERTRKDIPQRKHLKEKNSSISDDKTGSKGSCKISNDTLPKVTSEHIVSSPPRKRKSEDDRSSNVKKKLKTASKTSQERERKEKPVLKESEELPSEPKATPKSLERCDSASSLCSFTSQHSQKSIKPSKKNMGKVQAKECQESKRFKNTSQSSTKETKDLKKEEKHKIREKKNSSSGNNNSGKDKERSKMKEKTSDKESSRERESKKSSDSGWEDGNVPSSQGSTWEDSVKFETLKLSGSQQPEELVSTHSGNGDWEPTAPDQQQVSKLSNKHSSDYYLAEGKKLKHQADKEKDKIVQATKYLEAVLFFILTGNAMELNNIDTERIYKMFKETLSFSSYILSNIQKGMNNSGVENKLAVLSLMCQSLLYQKLYMLRKSEVKDFQPGISEFIKSLQINNRLPPTHSSPLSASHLPYSSRLPQPSPCQPRIGGTGGVPSPHSPTPSPAGSVASVGSQSSGYSSGELSGGHARSLSGGNHSTQFQSAASQLQVPSMQQQQGMINVPQNIIDMIQSQHTHLHNLHMCHELWEQVEYLITRHHSRDFFSKLNEQCGQLTLHSSFTELVDFVRRGLLYLKDYH